MQTVLYAQQRSQTPLQQAVLVYFVIPTACAVLFGWHRTAIPADLPRLYSIVAWICIFVPTWLAYDLVGWIAVKLCAPRRPPLWCLLLASSVIASPIINPALVWISETVFRIDVCPMPETIGDYIVTFGLNVAPFVALWVGANLVLVYQMGFSRFGYSRTPVTAALKGVDEIDTRPFDGGLLALSAEDHYVRLHFPDRSELVRMKFSDALAAVAARDGLRVHRSHWVARDAVSGIEQSGRQCMLQLSNGLSVPVSRSYRIALEEAGLTKSRLNIG